MKGEIRALIVDDEPNSREILEKLLKIEGSVKIVSKCRNISEAIVATVSQKPDIVFLDIEMPGGSGFEYVERLKPLGVKPEIIFVTAYNQYAIKAIKHSAFDYLLKPVDIDDLSGSIKRFKEENKKEEFSVRADNLIKQIQSIGKVRFYLRGGIIFIDPQDIVWCKASGSYTIIYFKTKKNEMVSIPLGDVEEMLEGFSFFRASRFVLINLRYIIKIDKKTHNCIIKYDDETVEIPVSPSYIKILE